MINDCMNAYILLNVLLLYLRLPVIPGIKGFVEFTKEMEFPFLIFFRVVIFAAVQMKIKVNLLYFQVLLFSPH